jgi:hypothetical protein
MPLSGHVLTNDSLSPAVYFLIHMNQESQLTRWPLPVRIAVLIAIMVYLTVMVWAPLTTPVGAPHLTTKVEDLIAPAQHALFLRHGYRFFAPDPGPTHALIYEIEMVDGTKTEGHFPDRENTSPRLLYHRWFMLSETLFREASQLPTEQAIKELNQRYETLIASFKQNGKTELIEPLTRERDTEMVQVRQAQQRCETMLQATARVLLTRFSDSDNSNVAPKSIRLWIQSRDQPTAEESIAGMELTDPVLMSRVEVGFYEAETLLGAPTKVTPGQSGAEAIVPAGAGVGAGEQP